MSFIFKRWSKYYTTKYLLIQLPKILSHQGHTLEAQRSLLLALETPNKSLEIYTLFHNLIMWFRLLLALQKYNVAAQMWLLIKKSLVRANGLLGDVLSKIMSFRKKFWVHKILNLQTLCA